MIPAVVLMSDSMLQPSSNATGELADLLDMAVPDLALKLIPAALPKLTEDRATTALEALAHSVGYSLQQMMIDYGQHVVAKYLYGGDIAMMAHTSILSFTSLIVRITSC